MKASPPAKRNDQIIHETGLTFHTQKMQDEGSLGVHKLSIQLNVHPTTYVIGDVVIKLHRDEAIQTQNLYVILIPY